MLQCGVGVHKAEIKVAAALVFSGGLNRGGSTCQVPQIVDRIHLPVAVAF